jgi:protein TonB
MPQDEPPLPRLAPKAPPKKVAKPPKPARSAKAKARPAPVDTAGSDWAQPASLPSDQKSLARGPTFGTAGSSGVDRSAQGSAAEASYMAQIRARIQRFKTYPPEARRQGIEGIVRVTFRLDSSGRLLTASVSSGTGVAILDNEALAIVRRASPFPPVPPSMGTHFTVTAPIRFTIR